MLRVSELKAAMAMRQALGYQPGDALCTDKSGPPPILNERSNYNSSAEKPYQSSKSEIKESDRKR